MAAAISQSIGAGVRGVKGTGVDAVGTLIAVGRANSKLTRIILPVNDTADLPGTELSSWKNGIPHTFAHCSRLFKICVANSRRVRGTSAPRSEDVKPLLARAGSCYFIRVW